ncbi:MAG: TetR/AcrR family transcriptional regulator [Oscillospiraceae bacterium]
MGRNKFPEETLRRIVDEATGLFIQKGYENTSIQDILDRLGGLSKGAIYHHFKSKEEIFQAVCRKIGEENIAYFDKIRDDHKLSGLEKLRQMVASFYANPGNLALFSLSSKIMQDPKFLMDQVYEIFNLSVPFYVQPVVEQGVADGSIKTAYPKELAESLLILTNIWLNPLIAKSAPEEMRRKLEFLSLLLKDAGADIISDDTIQKYVEFCNNHII